MTSLPPAPPAAPPPPGGSAPPLLERIRRAALIAGVAGIVLCVLGAFLSPAAFFRAYLYAYLVWLGIPLGAAAILMIHHLTGGRWGAVARRTLEAASRTLPVAALLFLPLLLGIQHLYIWSDPEAAAADEGIAYKRGYLNIPFWIIRAILYFALWYALIFLLNRWSEREGRAGDPADRARLAAISGPGLVLYVLSMTAASVDWVMSIDPHWYSTIFGLILVVGQALSAFAVAILILAVLSNQHPLSTTLRPGDFHDLGNLFMTAIMLWAYAQFSQFLIVWMGNIAEETPFYVARLAGIWGGLGVLLIILHFALPFLLLLSRATKRTIPAIAAVAAGVLLMRFIDLAWIVIPFANHAPLTTPPDAAAGAPALAGLHWLDFVTPIAIGGIWTAMFMRELARRPLLPLADPRLPAEEGGHHD